MYAHLLLQNKQLQNCVFGLNLEFMRYQVFLVATYTIVGKTPVFSIIKELYFVGQSKGIWFPSADVMAPIQAGSEKRHSLISRMFGGSKQSCGWNTVPLAGTEEFTTCTSTTFLRSVGSSRSRVTMLQELHFLYKKETKEEVRSPLRKKTQLSINPMHLQNIHQVYKCMSFLLYSFQYLKGT